MTPMVATSIVARLGRLACAYFHSSAHASREAAANAEKSLKIGITNAADLIDTRSGCATALTL